jgi:L,D-transpeptidase YcbB
MLHSVRARFTLTTVVALVAATWTLAAPPVDPPEANTIIAERLTAAAEHVLIGGESVVVHNDLRRFYDDRGHSLAWTAAMARDLTEHIRDAANDGLDPKDYRIDLLSTLVSEAPSGASRDPDLDLLSTDAFLRLSEHLLRGRIDPYELYGNDWLPVRRDRDLVLLLRSALEAVDIGSALKLVRPPHPEYRRLRLELARHRALAEMPPILPARPIALGDRDPRVPLIRERLHFLGHLAGHSGDDLTFDGALEGALRAFQDSRGLDPTGIVDNETRWLLNGAAGRDTRDIVLNLERWRWLPDDLGRTHLLLNIPAFELLVREESATVRRMRAVVGRVNAKTPVLSDSMRSITFNPTWAVPRSLVASETLPRARSQGASYLVRNRYTVYRGDDVIDARSVDWSRARASDYGFIQQPAPSNPMGKVKFNLGNPFDIYLHDTNEPNLLTRDERAFSSGCVRLEGALDLATWMLRHWSNWQPENIEEHLSRRSPEYVAPRDTWAIHLTYFTAWPEENGSISFFEDIYGHDAVLADALGLQSSATATSGSSR